MGSLPRLQRGNTELAGDNAYIASVEPSLWAVVSQIFAYYQYAPWRQIVHFSFIRLCLQTCHKAQPADHYNI